MATAHKTIAQLATAHGPLDEVLEIHDEIPDVPVGVYGVRKGDRTWVIDALGRTYAGGSFAAALVQEARTEWACKVCGLTNPPGTAECAGEHPPEDRGWPQYHITVEPVPGKGWVARDPDPAD
jgi:hypothetical protein